MSFSSLKPPPGPELERMESSASAEELEPGGAEEYTALLSAVFGESDTDEASNDQYCSEEEVGSESNDGYYWEKVEDVKGLWHCSSFLSLTQQESLLEAIDLGVGSCMCCPFIFPVQHTSKPGVRVCRALMKSSVAEMLWDTYCQAMRFGDLPGWARNLSTLIQSRSGGRSGVEALEPQESDRYSEIDGPNEVRENTSPFPSRILEREPLFDQMIVNLYQPGEGIAAHVDLLRFEDGIAIVSLKSSCVMSFRIVNNPSDGVEDTRTREPILDPHHDSSPGYGNHGVGPDTKEMPHSRPVLCEHLDTSGTIPQAKGSKSKSHTCERDPRSGLAKKANVLLNPGDLITAYGPARFNWTHEINRSEGNQLWHGQPIVQQRRVSVTLRRLCSQNDV